MTTPELVLHPLIIPSVVIPFTALLAALSALATFIAGLFGVRLQAEGPKKLLEVLLKPKVLAVALATNLAVLGAVAGYRYWKNSPVMLWRIEKRQTEIAKPSSLTYPDSEISPLASLPARASELGQVEVAWTRQLDAGSFRGAVVSGSSVFVGGNKGFVHEIDPESGDTRRSFFIGTPVSAAPLIYGGSLYAGEGVHDTHHARLYRFDLATGSFRGSYESKGHIEGEPTPASFGGVNAILVPSGVDGIAAVHAQTLEPLWHARDGHVDAGARAVDGIVFAGTGIEKEARGGKKGSAVAYELVGGKKLWQRELPASSWMQPIHWRYLICYVFGEVYFPSDLGGVHCFRRHDGAPDISYNQQAPVVATPILLGDDLVISDLKGKVCRVSLLNGRAAWCRETGEANAAMANPVLDSGTGFLLYPSQKNGLFVLDPDNGRVLANSKAEGEKIPWGKTYAPAASVPGGWILVDMKGVMRKLRWRAQKTSALAESN